jgi:triphosphoribosyl-dephospho-CoA synthase
MAAGMTAAERIRGAFLQACAWDVAVRKPGNVSRVSPGHGMQAQTFLDSAEAAAEPLCRPGARVGERIEAAMAATWARVGCNTNLGILLLCAPLAAAAEALDDGRADEPALQSALARVLAGLDRADAAAAFRAILRANPGGLGRAEAQDVHEAPSVNLREAMGLAAGRDRIARQYRDGYAELFSLGLGTLTAADRLALAQAAGQALGAAPVPADAAALAAVQRLYLAWLASAEDSHLVRKRGSALAQVVLQEAQTWAQRAATGVSLDGDAAFIAWDQALKRAEINPGTSADLTVATLMAAALTSRSAPPRDGTNRV